MENESNDHISTHWTQRKDHDIQNPGPSLGQKQKYAEVQAVNGLPALLIIGFPTTKTYTNAEKHAQIHFLWKRPHTITHNNERQYKHGQYSNRVNECS